MGALASRAARMSVMHGDCLDVMADMPAASVDAIVTDPPYGLKFMGKGWDHGVPGVPFWEAALRVAKPGAWLLAFGGTRTHHRLWCAIEDAGWRITDTLIWCYAQGFPKGRAQLKPSYEPIVMARKPGPLRDLDIEGCRLPTSDDRGRPPRTPNALYGNGAGTSLDASENNPAGRWPANVILTDPIFDGGWDGVVGGGDSVSTVGNGESRDPWLGGGRWSSENTYGDTGTYSRFFLIPKASRSDREPLVAGELTEQSGRPLGISQWEGQTNGSGKTMGPSGPRRNTHPTVKPVELMRHLVRLVTPAGGVVLDPFLGSGTTAVAAELEGFDWLGVEKEAEYVAIAEGRLLDRQRGLGI
jgi:site-specific DNA-methyltransferase (adenine-specific)